MTGFFPTVAIVAALVWVALLLNHPRTRVPLLYGTGIVLVASSAGVFTGVLTGVVARPAGAALIALAALSSPRASTVRSPDLAGRWAFALCAPLALYVVVTTAPGGQWTELTLYLAALCLPLVVIVATGGLALVDLRRSLIFSLLLIVGGSVIFGFVRPDLAIEGERLRGVLENANGLGFIAFLLGAVAILVPTRWSRLCLAMSAVALIWTASRASALALLLVGMLELFRRRQYAFGAALAAGIVLVTVLLTSLEVSAGPLQGLMRTTDSRSGSLHAAIADFRASPLWGTGLNNESAIIASSAFRALSNGGLLGLLCVALEGFFILRTSFVAGRAMVLAAAGLIHSLFEGWLLSPSSPFLLLFAGTWMLVARELPGSRGTDPAVNMGEGTQSLTGRFAR